MLATTASFYSNSTFCSRDEKQIYNFSKSSEPHAKVRRAAVWPRVAYTINLGFDYRKTLRVHLHPPRPGYDVPPVQ